MKLQSVYFINLMQAWWYTMYQVLAKTGLILVTLLCESQKFKFCERRVTPPFPFFRSIQTIGGLWEGKQPGCLTISRGLLFVRQQLDVRVINLTSVPFLYAVHFLKDFFHCSLFTWRKNIKTYFTTCISRNIKQYSVLYPIPKILYSYETYELNSWQV